MNPQRLLIATRASPLALAQAGIVAKRLTGAGFGCELFPLTTSGDTAPPNGRSNKEAFVDEIRRALLEQRCRLAVHSLKDVPHAAAPGLTLAAVTERAACADVLVAPGASGLDELEAGAAVGSASLRRRCLLLDARPDLRVREMRGNIHTRLKKLDSGDCRALILARAGLERVGLADRISCELPPESWLPAPGQGALAVECRTDDPQLQDFAEILEDRSSRLCTDAERALSEALGADCRAPLAALAQCAGQQVRLRALVGTADGSRLLRAERTAQAQNPQQSLQLGHSLAAEMRRQGAETILNQS